MAIALVVSVSASAQDDITEEYGQVIPASDTEYEWSQTDTKRIKVGFSKSQSLQFESKIDFGFAYSVVELPIDVEDNGEFLFGFNLKGFKPSGSSKKLKGSGLIASGFGMMFDYQDDRNYKGIIISQKAYQYFVVKDGTSSMVKSGPVKYKGDSYKLIMKRENGGVEILLNGIEVCKLRKITLSSSYFGVFIQGKGKAEMPSFIMHIPEQEESEESTSTT